MRVKFPSDISTASGSKWSSNFWVTSCVWPNNVKSTLKNRWNRVSICTPGSGIHMILSNSTWNFAPRALFNHKIDLNLMIKISDKFLCHGSHHHSCCSSDGRCLQAIRPSYPSLWKRFKQARGYQGDSCERGDSTKISQAFFFGVFLSSNGGCYHRHFGL